MQNQLFEAALGIAKSCYVRGIDFDVARKILTIGIYADKAYDRKLRDALAAAGITDGIMHKTRRNTPLKA